MSQTIATIPTFNDYGIEFQQQLIAELICDQKFGNTIIELLEPKYFLDTSLFFIVRVIKAYYDKHGIVPAKYEDLIIQIKIARPTSDTETMAILDTIEIIRENTFNNLNVQEEALAFCRFQAVRSAVKLVETKLKNGGPKDYKSIEDTLQKAFTVAEMEQPISLFSGIESALHQERRNTIPTGISGIDDVTGGGLSDGDVGLFIAPLGVGKTTALTVVASNGYLSGSRVLHIVFEDRLDDIKRKHYCAMSKVPLNELDENSEYVISKVNEIQSTCTGQIDIMKFPASGINISKIRNLIKRQNSKGRKIDLVVLDYVDCVEVERTNYEDEWGAEGIIMRKLETIAEDFRCAIWTATQGNRAAISSELITADKIGGSIKKAQFGHLIVGLGKTLEQKEMATGTITLIKNRFGRDGHVYENCLFDNGRMLIDTNATVSIGAFVESKEKERQRRINEKYAQSIASKNEQTITE